MFVLISHRTDPKYQHLIPRQGVYIPDDNSYILLGQDIYIWNGIGAVREPPANLPAQAVHAGKIALRLLCGPTLRVTLASPFVATPTSLPTWNKCVTSTAPCKTSVSFECTRLSAAPLC